MATLLFRRTCFSVGSPWPEFLSGETAPAWAFQGHSPCQKLCSSVGSPWPQFRSEEPAPTWALHGHSFCQENKPQRELSIVCGSFRAHSSRGFFLSRRLDLCYGAFLCRGCRGVSALGTSSPSSCPSPAVRWAACHFFPFTPHRLCSVLPFFRYFHRHHQLRGLAHPAGSPLRSWLQPAGTGSVQHGTAPAPSSHRCARRAPLPALARDTQSGLSASAH